MLRYYAIATALVLTVAVAATAYLNRDLIRIKIKGTDFSAPAKASHQGASTKKVEAFSGLASWALSALPECLTQQASSHGTATFVATQLPDDRVPVTPHSVLRYADCTIFYTGDEASVARGADRFSIPPHVRMYKSSKGLVVERIQGNFADMRIYTRSTLGQSGTNR